MPESKRPLQVFLSYASQDKPLVRELSRRLVAEGWIDTWQDEKNLLPGQDWRVKIEEAVEEADVVIIVLSQHSVSKEGHVQKELRYAREIALEKPDDAIFLIPLRLDECEVPRGLRFYQWADYFGDKKEETDRALLQSLRLRYDQKLRLEAEEQARQEKIRLETEKAVREKAEKEAAEKDRLKAEEEEQQKIAKEKADREAAEKFSREKAEKESVERVRLKIEEEERQRIAKEKAVREQAEKEVAEKVRRKAEEEEQQKNAKERAKREASEKAALEKAEKEAVEKARLKAEEEERQRIARKKADREATEKAAREKAKQIVAEKAARERTERKLRRQKLFEQISLNISNALPKIHLKKQVHPRYLAFVAILIFLVFAAWFLWNNKILFFSQIKNYPAEIVDAKGVAMRLVTAEKFIMGANIYQNDGVQISSENTIYLDAYYIDKYEVINSLYKECVNAGVCQDVNIPSGFYNVPDSAIGNFPVVNVNWSMANDYCAWRGAHLPTEAEWEKAARGTDGRNYPWGEEFDETIPNYGKPGGAPAPVGRYFKDKSPYEVYDMSGNVDEWVADWYSEAYYQDPPKNNPRGPDTGTTRVVKGGSFAQDDEIFLTTYERSDNDPSFGFSNLGFRCAVFAENTTLKPIVKQSKTPTPTLVRIAPPTSSPTATLTKAQTSTVVVTTEATSLSTEITDAKGVSMVLVPAGEFVMGSDNGYDNQKPAHKVYLTNYYIDKYEITNAQYKACVDAAICDVPEITFSESRDSYYGNPEFSNYPVIYVKWDMAVSYCKWRNMGLPTEAQWEKAASGTDERIYPWGYDHDNTLANYQSNIGDTSEIGKYIKGVSPYGAYDMAGNVKEWISDWYLENYYANALLSNPSGPHSGDFKVLRGGSWSGPSNVVEIINRDYALPNEINNDIGFRCVKPFESSEIDSMKLMYVPSGEFEMGSSDGLYEDERPPHFVYLDAFWIDQTEITNKQYQTCVEAGVCDPPADISSYSHPNYYGNSEFDNFPVVYIDWNSANRYCKLWVNRYLPSEAQWEKAARGVDRREYPWGDEKPNASLLNFGKVLGDVTEVGKYPKGISSYGVYDMAGNVMEWVNDWYSSDYYKDSPLMNPLGPISGEYVVYRGSAWDTKGTSIEVYSRMNNNASYNYYDIGFRCAKDAP